MLYNKTFRWIIALIYVVFFVWMWMHSKQPVINDVPVLFGAGLIASLLCLFSFKNKNANKVLMIINIALLIANIVMYFAAYRLVTGALKT